MKKVTRLTIIMLGTLIASAPAWADFGLQSFSTLGPSSLSGTAGFSLTGSTLSITLNNTSTSVLDNAHVLTGVGWNFTGTGTGLSIGSLTTPTGVPGYTCTGSGSSTSCIADGSVTTVPWTEQVGTGAVGAYPFNITSFTGNPKGTGIANDSIIPDGKDGLSSHQPHMEGPVTFTLLVSGMNLEGITGVSDVFIAFNTDGSGLATPEPGFYGVLSLGLCALLFAVRRKKMA